MGIGSDVFQLANYLLPGFLAAWIVHSLTSHKKPVQFERVIHALLLTIPIQFMVIVSHWAAVSWIGGGWGIGLKADFVAAVFYAVFIGHLFAYLTNEGQYHELMNRWMLTRKNSQPSEWHFAFRRIDGYVILYLDEKFGGKMLRGWPQQFPEDPENGYFIMNQCSWLIDEDGVVNARNFPNEDAILIAASSVLMVDFIGMGETTNEEQ